MNDLKEKAIKHLRNKDFGDALQHVEDVVLQSMIEFARECCEEQKKQCAKSALLEINFHNGTEYEIEVMSSNWHGDTGYFANKDSIVNCKNICDEQ